MKIQSIEHLDVLRRALKSMLQDSEQDYYKLNHPETIAVQHDIDMLTELLEQESIERNTIFSCG